MPTNDTDTSDSVTVMDDGREYDRKHVLTNHPDDVGPNGPDGATLEAPDADLTNGSRYRRHGQGPDGATPEARGDVENL